MCKRQNTAAAIISPLLGMATGLGVWLGSTKAMYGTVTVATSGQILPCVYGTVTSAFSPLPYTLIITFIKPQNYDWADFRKEKLAFASEEDLINADPTVGEELVQDPENSASQPHLRKWVRIATYWSAATFFGHWVLWPLPMYASKYIFSKSFFTAWLLVAIIWMWGTLFVAGFFPIIDGRRQFIAVWTGVADRKKSKAHHTAAEPFQTEKSSAGGSNMPSEIIETKQ